MIDNDKFVAFTNRLIAYMEGEYTTHQKERIKSLATAFAPTRYMSQAITRVELENASVCLERLKEIARKAEDTKEHDESDEKAVADTLQQLNATLDIQYDKVITINDVIPNPAHKVGAARVTELKEHLTALVEEFTGMSGDGASFGASSLWTTKPMNDANMFILAQINMIAGLRKGASEEDKATATATVSVILARRAEAAKSYDTHEVDVSEISRAADTAMYPDRFTPVFGDIDAALAEEEGLMLAMAATRKLNLPKPTPVAAKATDKVEASASGGGDDGDRGDEPDVGGGAASGGGRATDADGASHEKLRTASAHPSLKI